MNANTAAPESATMSTYEICKVPNYQTPYPKSKKLNGGIDVINALLMQDFQFHERLEKEDNLKLCVDVDKMLKYNAALTLDKIIADVCDFVKCAANEISYTTNFSVADGSHHLVIPKYFMKSSAQKCFWKEFQTKYNYGNEIDAGIFDKSGWFRLPNQTKERLANTEHIIQRGEIQDFVLKCVENAVEYVYEPAETTIAPFVAPIPKKECKKTDAPVITIETDDRYLTLLFDVIKNEKDEKNNAKVSWDNWFKICGILKSNGYDYDVFKRYSALNDVPDSSATVWQSSNNKNMSIHGLQNIAKEINPAGYAIWKRRFCTKLYNELFTSGLLAEYFSIEFGKLFIYSNDVLYFYTGVYWKPDDKLNSNLIKFIDGEFYNHLLKTTNEDLKYKSMKLVQTTDVNEKEALDKDIVKLALLLKNITTIRKNSVRKDIVKDIIIMTTNNDIQFDNEPHLFAFKNAVFDLRTAQEIKPAPEQYLSITCGFRYDREYNLGLKNELNEILISIFPNPAIRNYFLHILATGLSGVQMENLFIYTGVGGNGKSLLNSLFLKLLGDYGYKLPSSVIQGDMKTGANPEIANLHKKRYVVAQEPDRKKKLSCAIIKEITGDKTINARQLYSGNTKTELNLTLCVECNDKPLLDEVNAAVIRRFRVIPFETQSISQKDYDALPEDERANINVANAFFKTDEFQEKYKQALFFVLIDKFKDFNKNHCVLPDVPVECLKETRQYMALSDDLYDWFCNIYEPLSSDELNTALDVPIPLSAIYTEFNTGDLFRRLKKEEQRKYSKKNFVAELEKNIFIGKMIRRRDTRYNNVKINTDYIVGWKKQVDEIVEVVGTVFQPKIKDENVKYEET